MRSGEHAVWDAHLARVHRARVEDVLVWLSADARGFVAAMGRAQRQLGVAAAQASRSLGRALAAWEASQPSAMDQLRLLTGKRPRGG